MNKKSKFKKGQLVRLGLKSWIWSYTPHPTRPKIIKSEVTWVLAIVLDSRASTVYVLGRNEVVRNVVTEDLKIL